jgi:hypothetical protein
VDVAILFSKTAASELTFGPLRKKDVLVILPANSLLVPTVKSLLTMEEAALLPLVLSSSHHNIRRRITTPGGTTSFSGVLRRSTAIEMANLKVAGCIRPAGSPLHSVCNIPADVHCEGLLAVGARAILLQPDTVQLTVASRRVPHLLTPSGFEVRRTLRIVWIGIRFDLDMPLYWRVRFLQQGDLSCRAILLFFCGGKYPVPEAFGLEVFDFYPSGAFASVPSCRLSP